MVVFYCKKRFKDNEIFDNCLKIERHAKIAVCFFKKKILIINLSSILVERCLFKSSDPSILCMLNINQTINFYNRFIQKLNSEHLNNADKTRCSLDNISNKLLNQIGNVNQKLIENFKEKNFLLINQPKLFECSSESINFKSGTLSDIIYDENIGALFFLGSIVTNNYKLFLFICDLNSICKFEDTIESYKKIFIIFEFSANILYTQRIQCVNVITTKKIDFESKFCIKAKDYYIPEFVIFNTSQWKLSFSKKLDLNYLNVSEIQYLVCWNDISCFMYSFDYSEFRNLDSNKNKVHSLDLMLVYMLDLFDLNEINKISDDLVCSKLANIEVYERDNNIFIINVTDEGILFILIYELNSRILKLVFQKSLVYPSYAVHKIFFHAIDDCLELYVCQSVGCYKILLNFENTIQTESYTSADENLKNFSLFGDSVYYLASEDKFEIFTMDHSGYILKCQFEFAQKETIFKTWSKCDYIEKIEDESTNLNLVELDNEFNLEINQKKVNLNLNLHSYYHINGFQFIEPCYFVVLRNLKNNSSELLFGYSNVLFPPKKIINMFNSDLMTSIKKIKLKNSVMPRRHNWKIFYTQILNSLSFKITESTSEEGSIFRILLDKLFYSNFDGKSELINNLIVLYSQVDEILLRKLIFILRGLLTDLCVSNCKDSNYIEFFDHLLIKLTNSSGSRLNEPVNLLSALPMYLKDEEIDYSNIYLNIVYCDICYSHTAYLNVSDVIYKNLCKYCESMLMSCPDQQDEFDLIDDAQIIL